MEIFKMKLKTTTLLTTLLFTGLSITACCEKPAEDAKVASAQTHAEHSHEGHDHSQMDLTEYTCEPAMDIKAHYVPVTNEHDATAHILIDDIEYDMYLDVSASGELYRTETGLTEGNGLIWHTKGKDALLESFDIAKPHDQASIKTIASCQKK